MKTGCQIYVKGSVEAVAFYQRAFKWTIGTEYKNADGTYEHVELKSGRRGMLAVAEDGTETCSPDIQGGKRPAMSFNCWDLKSREAVDQAYNVLSEGARSIENPDGPAPLPWNNYCFYLVDKFGVHWWVAA